MKKSITIAILFASLILILDSCKKKTVTPTPAVQVDECKTYGACSSGEYVYLRGYFNNSSNGDTVALHKTTITLSYNSIIPTPGGVINEKAIQYNLRTNGFSDNVIDFNKTITWGRIGKNNGTDYQVYLKSGRLLLFRIIK